MIITGLTGAFFANYALAHSAGGSTQNLWMNLPAWRWMFWLQVIPALIYLFTLLLIPESPRYLVLKGRDADAQVVLTKLFGEDYAREKVAEIRASLASDHHRPKFSDLLDANGKVRPILWAGIGLAVFQQFVGINIVFYYGAVLWRSVGFSENDALIINIISGLVSIGACVLTIFTVDKIGRKPLLLIGSLGMGITLSLMAYAFSTATLVDGSLHLTPDIGKLAFVSALAYSALFNLSWGPIMWVMLGEMFPTQIRGSGLAVSGFAQWGANFLISVSFPWAAENVGLPITYGFYAASAFLSFFFVKALINETRGRELEDMEG
jgi:SP family sugar:H+ symporter-like MFS transporter